MTVIAFMDAETTGLDPWRDRIWELAVIVRRPGLPDAEHAWQIAPRLDAPLSDATRRALAVGGYDARCQVRGQPPGTVATIAGGIRPAHAAGLARDLAAMLDGAQLAGINVSFDRDFTAAFCARHGERLAAGYHLAELCSMTAGWLHGRGSPVPAAWRSDDLARAAGIDPAAYDRHTALGDARYARDLYDRVTGALAA